MKVVFWFVVALVAAVLALFAAGNREPVALGLWPLPFVVQLPLYLAVLGGLAVGFAVGAVAAWLGGRDGRREARRRARRIRVLERELADTQAQLPSAVATAPAALAARG